MKSTGRLALSLMLVGLLASSGWAVEGGFNSISNPGLSATATKEADANFHLRVGSGGMAEFWACAARPNGVPDPLAVYNPDTHTMYNIEFLPSAVGTEQVILGAGNPRALGVGGTVELQLYIAGPQAGADVFAPEYRADFERIWGYVSNGMNGLPGIVTSQITDPGRNGLGVNGFYDAWGSSYIGINEMQLGDVNGDFNVDINDISSVLAYLDQDPLSFGYNSMTWLEGDINGDFVVDINDVSTVLANLDQAYVPANGGGFASAAAVPEPGTVVLGLFGAIGLALVSLRRKVK